MVSKERKYKEIYFQQMKIIESKLNRLLANRKPRSLYEPSSYFLESGGKRLRPLLVLLSAKAVGAKFADAYNAALAAELLHNFTLVHDDIMDNADKRRGRKTLHKKYDINTAILAGDSLLSVAYENLLKDCNGNTKEIISAFTKGLVEVCEGQSLDKEFEYRTNVTLSEYLLMIRKKTAAMAEMCCSIGALIGDGNKMEVKALESFGRNLGIAFQIQDDLLDLTADEAEFGKVIGGDLIEGKKTFLLIQAMEKAKGKDKESIKRIIKNKGIPKSKVNYYKKIFARLGVFQVAKKSIILYSNLAIKAVDGLPDRGDRDIFKWIAHSLMERIK